ncbi:hypothetical protein CEXT_42781 [Caerostris extrusa]|uniref:Uncharacterized protein n=1 Tax=Caerostris extrusa TaxID=172846 RepID=A0AAV4TWJ0_CAEEX|nr:hypothetical protein CEXT_42781 [Caerostris extrusa]
MYRKESQKDWRNDLQSLYNVEAPLRCSLSNVANVVDLGRSSGVDSSVRQRKRCRSSMGLEENLFGGASVLDGGLRVAFENMAQPFQEAR